MLNILLDMDGVIANFFRQACAYHYRDYCPEEITNYNISETWGMTDAEFWEPLNCYEFWAGIEPYPYAHEMVEKLKAIAPVHICTAQSKNHSCYGGKVDWLEKHFGLGIDDVTFTRDKWRLANQETILIDDHSEKVDAFIKRDGIGILFPQPWNDGFGSWETVLQQVKTTILVKYSQKFGSPETNERKTKDLEYELFVERNRLGKTDLLP